jgi:hypothetical protein
VIRGISKPGVLGNLAVTAKYMGRIKREYEKYPDYRDFPAWVEKVEGIFREYSSRYLRR